MIRETATNIPSMKERKRVASYARVSGRKDAMLQSMSEQVS